MKTLMLLCSLVLATVCHAQVNNVQMMFVASSAESCTTDNDVEMWAPANQASSGGSSVVWAADKITFASAVSVTAYLIKQQDINSDIGSVNIVLMNHDSENDYPDKTSEVANSSITDPMTTVSSSVTVIEHQLSSTLSLPAGTYWLVNRWINGAIGEVTYSTSSTGDRACYSSNDGATWTCIANTAYDMEVWGCE